ncbi:hypothetical protein llap_22750 [Limosa lapponica baueri]|uniref:Uncharacterized protein n=1 Tax=Limosa lapponica baueri TaxID=1758121 RepID=A0A2I0SZG5_LIMLA|nr:hypothetical protein llap_22750 [Limosa lapponica baueri]
MSSRWWIFSRSVATSFSSWADLGKGEDGVQEPSGGFPERQHPPSSAQSGFYQPGLFHSRNILARQGKERQRQSLFRQEPQRLATTDCRATGTSGRVRPQNKAFQKQAIAN